jgi:T5SS/PEP-CTERM-associated repeat protein
VSGFFNEPTRWSINDIPGEQDGVRFNAFTTAVYTVTVIQDQATRSVTVDSSDVRLDLAGTTYSLAQATGTALRVGTRVERPGALIVLGGTLAANHAVIGDGPGSDGAMALGLFGDAATLELNGILEVGRHGVGGLGLYSGSTTTIRRGLWIGVEEGSSGAVDGTGGLLQVTEGADATLIGLGGTGSLSVDGSTVSLVGTVNVGSAQSGNGTLRLASGASATTHNALQVGVAGIGGLELTGGSVLTSADAVIGLQPGAFGTVLVDGLDSRWEIVNSSRIGVAGAALFQVQNGATVCFNGSDHHVGPQGTVTIYGNVVISGTGCPPSEMNGKTSVPGGALLATHGLFLDDGAVLEADTLMLEDGGVLGGDATLDLTITNAGTLSPGGTDATGVLALANDYAQAAAGVLEIEFGGTTPGTGYDQLEVTGTASVGGTLHLDRITGYTPMIGEAYTLLTATSVTGTFSAIDQPEDLAFDLSYTSTEIVATVAAVNVSNDADPNAVLPQTFELQAAYPNPFDRKVTIPFDLSEAGAVHMAVYDVLGREVALLATGTRPVGRHEAVLDGTNLKSGAYLVRLSAGGFTQTRRITLLR